MKSVQYLSASSGSTSRSGRIEAAPGTTEKSPSGPRASGPWSDHLIHSCKRGRIGDRLRTVAHNRVLQRSH